MPIVVGLWPVLLTGVWAINKRKEKIAEQEQAAAVQAAKEQAAREKTKALEALQQKLAKEKETAIAAEVKKALEEAEQKARQAAAPDETTTDTDPAADTLPDDSGKQEE
ncbi:MAG: hypothetical protein R6V15_07835 [Desulfotignum sp.]